MLLEKKLKSFAHEQGIGSDESKQLRLRVMRAMWQRTQCVLRFLTKRRPKSSNLSNEIPSVASSSSHNRTPCSERAYVAHGETPRCHLEHELRRCSQCSHSWTGAALQFLYARTLHRTAIRTGAHFFIRSSVTPAHCAIMRSGRPECIHTLRTGRDLPTCLMPISL